MDTQYIDGFIGELLHINEVADNKLIDLNACGGTGTYFLSHTCADQSAYALLTVGERLGKTGTTILLNSALAGGEQRVNRKLNTFEWRAAAGGSDVKSLHAFIAGARKDLIARGNNPLFLSVGALKWRVIVKEQGKETLKDVLSPLLIFPVKLIVTSNSAPVAIEFIDDDVYVNPCLTAKLAQIFGSEVAEGLPAVGGGDIALPVDLSVLGDGVEYFNAVAKYVEECNHTDGADSTLFEFDKDCIAVAQYKHDELCTYYDIRRNKEKIYSHPLVERLFSKSSPEGKRAGDTVLPDYVLQRDSVQESIITRVVNGESLIIKGPPGTGKTVTIANMLASLLAQNKKVLFASKKISALTEVYAKLPENLRKFTMLLESETESAAAKIRPDEVKQDFKRLLAESKQYREPASLDADVKQTAAERAKAMRALSAYIELLFNDKCIAEDNFYNALDIICKNDMPVIEFAESQALKKVSRAQYNHMLTQAGEAQKAFDVLGGNGAHPVYKCPWFGLDLACDSEGALAASEETGKLATEISARIEVGLKERGLNLNDLTLAQVYGAATCGLGGGQIETIASDKNCAEILSETEKRLNDYLSLLAGEEVKVQLPKEERAEARVIKLGALKCDKSLNLAQIKLIKQNEAISAEGGGLSGKEAFAAVVKLTEGIAKAEAERAAHLSRSCEAFKNDLTAEQAQEVISSRESLLKYFENCPEKPKGLDFKAKKAYAKLCGLSFLPSPSFRDIVGATEQFCLAYDCLRTAEEIVASMYKLFHRQLSADEVACVRLVAEKCADGNISPREYVRSVVNAFEFICDCYSFAAGDCQGATLGALCQSFEREYRLQLLIGELEKLNETVAVYGEAEAGRESEIARGLVAAGAFIQACKRQGVAAENIAAAAEYLRGESAAIADRAQGVTDGLKEFGVKYFKNYYSINGDDSTFGDFKILAAQAGDRDVIAAAASYTALKNSPSNALDLGAFLYWFEKGGKLKDGLTFKDAFEHSFFSLAVRARDSELGIMRNGLGAYAQNNLDKLAAADEKLCGLNAKITECKCLARIKPDDGDYIFVQDRNPNENLRLMFKRHPEAVLKLKRCLILSPYTASLLFNGEEYEDFDVLIIDEASQLEPALALPVLFRSKQCVIVGDEWQMPPIKHFAALSPVQGDGTEGYAGLESEISVLGLALRNEGFSVSELICHYRSKTEALIKYSQEAFYPNMRTFPSPVPAVKAEKGVKGLGFKDVYVPEGFVTAGKNAAEAEKVLEELRLHFDNYYDEKTKTLSMSVGVVAFGEAQCSAIEAKVKADAKLWAKIQRALENFDDLPEKLLFFKTIETVQGQETEHLILSITHGKRESGLHMHFGQLNQGKLGRCIFNVAVTRAQSLVTVVHSVRAAEITGDSVSYIRDYLYTVERFSREGEGGFLTDATESGFVKQVAEFVRSCGVPKERVIVNYGVTEGSVRIPVAVLDKGLKRAVFSVWCEKPVGGRYDFLDYNMRYAATLKNCGWRLHTVYIHDWTDNKQNEQRALADELARIINEEENN